MIPGSEHAFTFKTLAEALLLRNHVIERFERADVETDPRSQVGRPVGTIGCLWLMAQGFEREVIRLPEELLSHRVKLLDQGPGLCKSAFHRQIFKDGRRITGHRREG